MIHLHLSKQNMQISFLLSYGQFLNPLVDFLSLEIRFFQYFIPKLQYLDLCLLTYHSYHS